MKRFFDLSFGYGKLCNTNKWLFVLCDRPGESSVQRDRVLAVTDVPTMWAVVLRSQVENLHQVMVFMPLIVVLIG